MSILVAFLENMNFNEKHFIIFSRSEEFNNENAPQSCDQQLVGGQSQQPQQQHQGLHPPNEASETEETTLVEGIIDLTSRLELKVS